MAVFEASGKYGTALCVKCKVTKLLSLLLKTNCGRWLAACPLCKKLYTTRGRATEDHALYCSAFDMWEWLPIEKVCLGNKR